MRAPVLALALLLLPASAVRAKPAAPGPSGPEGLCLAGEAVFFACSTTKGLAYVCGTKSPAGQGLQYRFGQPGKVSLSYPAHATPPAGVFHFSSTAYSGGGEAHLVFDNDGFRYVLFDRTTAGDRDAKGHRAHDFSTGVLVKKDGRIVSKLICKGADDTLRAPAYDLPAEDFDYDLVP